MINVRKSEDRGAVDFGWLKSMHSFSFGEYFDPAHMGFGPLRVINEDIVQPDQGFPTHGHKDMEIISYVIKGELAHKDTLGNGSIIRRGDVQRMTAGSGIRHSEYNASSETDAHFLQIWIVPEKQAIDPSYEQITLSPAALDQQFGLIASRDGRGGTVRIHNDVDLYAAKTQTAQQLTLKADSDRLYWLQVVAGSAEIAGVSLKAGDGAAIERQDSITLDAAGESEFLLFDMVDTRQH